MPESHITYAFVAGELSDSYFGRTDLTKYNLGLALAENFFIDYRGGTTSRAGYRMLAQLLEDDKDIRLERFRATGNDYVLVFGHNYLRFMRNGGYLVEGDKVISGITQADPAVVTATGHSYADGDLIFIKDVVGMVQVNSRLFVVANKTTNDFELQLVDGTDVDATGYTAYASAGVAQRTVVVTTTYASTVLESLNFEQDTVDMYIQGEGIPRAKLTYTSDTSWALVTLTAATSAVAPANLTLTPSSAATAGVAFSVTTINQNGEESIGTEYEMTELTVDYTGVAGSMKIGWDPVDGALEYNVYRSLVLPIGADISVAQELGFLGRAIGAQFVDNNIIPDFTKAPPTHFDPFASSPVSFIGITAQGSGYAKSDTVSVTGGGGSGFVGYPIVNAAGNILGVVVVNGGSGYSSPVVSFSTSTGSNATATATLGEATGNDPSVMAIFQQRAVFGGTTNLPMTVFGSKPGLFNNFDVSPIVNAGDGYTFTLDSRDVSPIKHLVPLRNGLITFTQSSIQQLKAETGKAVSAVNAFAETQSIKSVSDVKPVVIDLDVLFTQEQGSAVFGMAYTYYTDSFGLQDLSALADHLLGEGKAIKRMEYIEEPFKLIHSVREDGVMLNFTYVREHEVFAWTHSQTRGLYKDLVAIKENNRDTLYMVVERFLNGKWLKFIERQEPRIHSLVEDYWCVDCGLAYVPAEFTAAVGATVSAVTGTGITFTAGAASFTADNVGDIIYFGGGKLEITAFTSTTIVTCTALRDVTDVVLEDYAAPPMPLPQATWSMGTPISTITGLWHLEGETVSVLADGDAFLTNVVTDGEITLDNAATKVIVGLQYKCRAKTLPLTSSNTIIEGKRKDVVGVAARIKDTRGLAFGADFDNLFEMKDRTDEEWGEILRLRNESTYETLEGVWDTDGSMVWEQKYPLPATVLGLVVDADIGDE